MKKIINSSYGLGIVMLGIIIIVVGVLAKYNLIDLSK
jgi:hypothetical protein